MNTDQTNQETESGSTDCSNVQAVRVLQFGRNLNQPSGCYQIQYRKEVRILFWTIGRWVTIDRWLGCVKSWNPVLLPYDQAIEFAKKMKSKERHVQFCDKQREQCTNSKDSEKERLDRLYPVKSQEV